jgi:hypothetical protein
MYMPFLTMCRVTIWHRRGKEASVVRPMKFRELGVGLLMLLLFGLERLEEKPTFYWFIILSFRIYSCFYWNLVINVVSRCVQLMMCAVGCKCSCYVYCIHEVANAAAVFTAFMIAGWVWTSSQPCFLLNCLLKICCGTYQYRLSELDLVLWWATCKTFMVSDIPYIIWHGQFEAVNPLRKLFIIHSWHLSLHVLRFIFAWHQVFL